MALFFPSFSFSAAGPSEEEGFSGGDGGVRGDVWADEVLNPVGRLQTLCSGA